MQKKSEFLFATVQKVFLRVSFQALSWIRQTPYTWLIFLPNRFSTTLWIQFAKQTLEVFAKIINFAKNARFFYFFCKFLIYNSLAYALVAYFATTIRFHFVLDKNYLLHLQPCSQKHMFCKASEFFKLPWICKTTSMFSGQHHDAFVPTKSSAFLEIIKFVNCISICLLSYCTLKHFCSSFWKILSRHWFMLHCLQLTEDARKIK